MRTGVFSDGHLGDGSLADDFATRHGRLIKNVDRDWVDWHRSLNLDLTIINGDWFERWQFTRSQIERAHASLLNYLANNNVIWIRGNHDYELTGKLWHDIETPSGLIHFEHGFRNDKGMTSPWARAGVWAMGAIERMIPDIDKLGQDKKSCVGDQINRNTIKLAHQQMGTGKYRCVVYGHTHRQGTYLDGAYFNSGDCTEGKRQGIVIDGDSIQVVG